MSSPESTSRRHFFSPFVLGAGSGFVAGLLLGVAVMALLGWAWVTVEEDYSANPVADLDVPDRALTVAQSQKLVDRMASEYLESSDNVGLVIAMLRDDKSFVSGYGETLRGSSVRPNGDTLFEIASVGKTLTSTILAEMVLRGELKLDDSLAKYVPDGTKVPRHGPRHISMLDLATHSSGLPSLPPNFTFGDPLNPYKDYTVDQMFTGVGRITLPRAPGVEYEYSNLGFGLLGYVLAKRAEMDFEKLVIERLCVPLGMNSTRMTLDEELKARLATPHDNGRAVLVWEDTTMPGAGSFLSTANDLIRFLQTHWQVRGAEPSVLQQAMDLATQKHRRGASPPESLGLGWHISSENALDIIWHNGGSGGSASYVAFLPRQKVGVIVLSNSTSSVDDIGHKLLYLLAWH